MFQTTISGMPNVYKQSQVSTLHVVLMSDAHMQISTDPSYLLVHMCPQLGLGCD